MKKNVYQESIKLHKQLKGKIEVIPKIKITNDKQLALAYSPGVAQPCLEIQKNEQKIYNYTSKSNMVAIISDGSAVLGLGNIGAKAALPVMEGKAMIFKEFANVNAFPICINTQDNSAIISTIKLITTSFGAINLEDIAAPRCFEIAEILKKELDIPIFHDDQDGTAIAVAAAIINACRLTNKNIKHLKVCICGLGAAGVAIAKLLSYFGIISIYGYDKTGVITNSKFAKYNSYVQKLLKNKIIVSGKETDKLADIVKDSHVFIGVSAGNIITSDMIRTMKPQPWVFALANPYPEIDPKIAKMAGAYIIATGRGDYPNQINNSLVFPGLFKAVLQNNIIDITEEVKKECATAIANVIPLNKLTPTYIMPSIFDKKVVTNIVKAINRGIKQEKLSFKKF